MPQKNLRNTVKAARPKETNGHRSTCNGNFSVRNSYGRDTVPPKKESK